MNYKVRFTDKVELKKLKGIDEYGKQIFEEIKEINVKKEDKVKLIKNLKGKEVVSTSTIFVLPEEDIKIGDFIGNIEVVFTTLKKDRKGRPAFWEVYL